MEKVRSLLAEEANVNSRDDAGFRPLHCAVCGGHKEVAGFLLDRGADVKAEDTEGWTPLMLSADNVEMAAMLISGGADVNTKGKITGVSVLHLAVKRGNAELVKLLLSQGANVNGKASQLGWQGWTPLHIACENRWWGSEGIVEMLLAKGAEVNTRTDDGDTPLSLARGHSAIIRLLREYGAKE